MREHRLFIRRVALILMSLFLAPLMAQAALYAPGATLDPACAPTDANCGVESNVASATAGQVPYYAANGNVLSATSTFTILQNGNIGIGTTSPAAKLDVFGDRISITQTHNAADGLVLQQTAGAGAGSPRIMFFGNNDLSAGNAIYRNPSFGLTFLTGSQLVNTTGTERMVISDSGNVGINQIFPSYLLDVFGPGHFTGLVDAANFVATSTTATSTFAGKVGIGTTTPFALLSVSNSVTTPANTPLFAIASTTGGTSTTTVFSVANTGNVTINGSSGSTCTIGNGSGGTSCTSDARLKTNIALIVNPLESIEQLRGVTFTWADPTKDQHQFIGVIAQDVAKVFPQAVATTADGFLSVDYGALVAPLIEAVKELAGQVTQLAATVTGFTDSFTTKHLCVTKSDGTNVCITGDELGAILNQAGAASVSSAPVDTIHINDVPPPESISTTTDSTDASSTTSS